jgi:hypothetical protein
MFTNHFHVILYIYVYNCIYIYIIYIYIYIVWLFGRPWLDTLIIKYHLIIITSDLSRFEQHSKWFKRSISIYTKVSSDIQCYHQIFFEISPDIHRISTDITRSLSEFQMTSLLWTSSPCSLPRSSLSGWFQSPEVEWNYESRRSAGNVGTLTVGLWCCFTMKKWGFNGDSMVFYHVLPIQDFFKVMVIQWDFTQQKNNRGISASNKTGIHGIRTNQWDPMGVFLKVYHAIMGKSNGMNWYKESIFQDYGIYITIDCIMV